MNNTIIREGNDFTVIPSTPKESYRLVYIDFSRVCKEPSERVRDRFEQPGLYILNNRYPRS